MTPVGYGYGFRVLGPATEARRLIDWAAAFRAYAACDTRAECQREAYLSAFTFGADFSSHSKATGSTAGFAGPCWAPFIWWDLDRDKLADALDAARRLAGTLTDGYGVADTDLLVFLSGGKGFHVGLPTALWAPAPGPLFHRTARYFAEALAELGGIEIDAGIYDRVRLLRAPNSRHPKSGLYKRRLSVDALMHLDADALRSRAEHPEPFDLPAPTGTNAAAVNAWQTAAHYVQREAEANAARAAAGTSAGRLNRSTLQFMREGAAVGDRHRLLYSAAANLREFGAPAALVHELLTDAALDTGLAPAEVRRCIDNALTAGSAGVQRE